MFNSIYGKITAKSGERICLETGGLEWDLAVSTHTAEALPPVGSQARLFVWLWHREDMLRLFGFSGEEERGVFLALQKVEGVGPRAALRILSGITVAELGDALQTADLSRLEKISGIGKKTAQKMLLALQGQIVFDTPSVPAASAAPWADVVTALVNMGYDRRRCEELMPALAEKTDAAASRTERENQLFRLALLELAT